MNLLLIGACQHIHQVYTLRFHSLIISNILSFMSQPQRKHATNAGYQPPFAFYSAASAFQKQGHSVTK